MSIYRNKKGLWVGTVELGNENGTRKRKVIYSKTKKELELKMNKISYEIQMGEYLPLVKDGLINFLEEYYSVSEKNWEETTRALYKMYIDVHFKPYFKEMRLVEVKPLVLDKFYKSKLQGERPLSVNTARKLNGFLKTAFKYAAKNDYIKSNPAADVVLGKKKKYEPKVYEVDQFTKLLTAVTGTEDEIPILLGGACGLRRGEVFGLTWNDIDFEKRTISISRTNVRFNKNIEKKPKTESSRRTFIVPDLVLNVLLNYKKKKKAFGSENVVTKWIAPSYSGHFKDLLIKHNLEHIRFHDLRHYNAVIMLRLGISDKVAAERLGHASLNTLRGTYQHVLKDMDETAAAQINNSFKNII